MVTRQQDGAPSHR